MLLTDFGRTLSMRWKATVAPTFTEGVTLAT